MFYRVLVSPPPSVCVLIIMIKKFVCVCGVRIVYHILVSDKCGQQTFKSSATCCWHFILFFDGRAGETVCVHAYARVYVYVCVRARARVCVFVCVLPSINPKDLTK